MNYILDEHGIHDNTLSPTELFWSLFAGIEDVDMEVPVPTMKRLLANDDFLFLRKGYSFEDLTCFLPTLEGMAFDMVPFYQKVYGQRPGKVIVVRTITYGSHFTFQCLYIDQSYFDSLYRKKVIDEVLVGL